MLALAVAVVLILAAIRLINDRQEPMRRGPEGSNRKADPYGEGHAIGNTGIPKQRSAVPTPLASPLGWRRRR